MTSHDQRFDHDVNSSQKKQETHKHFQFFLAMRKQILKLNTQKKADFLHPDPQTQRSKGDTKSLTHPLSSPCQTIAQLFRGVVNLLFFQQNSSRFVMEQEVLPKHYEAAVFVLFLLLFKRKVEKNRGEIT